MKYSVLSVSFRIKVYFHENTAQQSSWCLTSWLWHNHSPQRERERVMVADIFPPDTRQGLEVETAVLHGHALTRAHAVRAPYQEKWSPPCHLMPELLVLSPFSQQLIDVVSCGHSWLCSLANMNKQQRVLYYCGTFSCQIECRSLFSKRVLTHYLLSCFSCLLTFASSLPPSTGEWIQFDSRALSWTSDSPDTIIRPCPASSEFSLLGLQVVVDSFFLFEYRSLRKLYTSTIFADDKEKSGTCQSVAYCRCH